MGTIIDPKGGGHVTGVHITPGKSMLLRPQVSWGSATQSSDECELFTSRYYNFVSAEFV